MKTAGYSGTPLLSKLGVKEGSRLGLMNAPAGFSKWLPALPDGASVSERGAGEADVIVLFAMSARDLKSLTTAIQRMPPGSGMLWVAWPKKASKIVTDLTENIVRDAGLALGLVDTKVCAIDDTWSGLRFSRRRMKA
ncbi:MAG: DUF3052 domain-containing protein [Gemmatimonadales bacterium]